METNKLQNLIGKYNANKAEQAKNEYDAYIARMVKYKETLNSWNEKICKWKEHINMLIANGFVFYSESFWRFRSVPYKQKEIIEVCTIGTDCIYHTFGIFNSANYFDGKMPSKCENLGIAQGGACGDWHIHTDGKSWWIQKGSQTAELREQDYKDLFRRYGDENLNKLERFEKKMEKLYAYLEKAAA
jgi:hypothetical protein